MATTPPQPNSSCPITTDSPTPYHASPPLTRGVPKGGYANPNPGWEEVPAKSVETVCKLGRAELQAADMQFRKKGVGFLIVRYGKICWRSGDTGSVVANESATKTLAATALGILAHMTAGAVQPSDLVSKWFTVTSPNNSNSTVADVASMVSQSSSLVTPEQLFCYAETPAITDFPLITSKTLTAHGMGSTAQFIATSVFGPLGMTNSTWSGTAWSGWQSNLDDMARLGLLLLHDGWWSGTRLLDPEWVSEMTHPANPQANTAYGYFTWLNASRDWCVFPTPCEPSNKTSGSNSLLTCAPTVTPSSCATNCPLWDIGVWEANGAGGQLIIGHPGLDMVIVARNWQSVEPQILFNTGKSLWEAIVPAIVAKDPTYPGNSAGFCAAYGSNQYAPDLNPTP